MIALGLATGIAIQSAFIWWRRARCTSCRPRCPNGHQQEIAGSQGMLIASVMVIAGFAVEALLK